MRQGQRGAGEIEGQMEALAGTFKEYSEQNQKLSGLYELAKQRIQELTGAGRRIGRDMAFLRDYCHALERELTHPRSHKHQDILERKETADGIFLTYSQAHEDAQPHQDAHLEAYPSACSLAPSLNQRLQPERGKAEQEREERLERACRLAEQRVSVLEQELRGLRESLEWERERRGTASAVLRERSDLFGNIHRLIGEYKRKISLLGHEKKEVERKYKQLKEKVSRLDEHAEYKMIDLYAEKIDVLQRLTEKQQAEIENTIELYEVELIKIEERRREEIDHCHNERLDLETENLRLCIDLQKSLNGRDEAALQLMHERNKNEILLQEIIHLREALRSHRARHALAIAPAFTLALPPCPSSSCPSQSERSSVEQVDYQFSEVEDRRELIERLEDVSIRRDSSAKKSLRDRITITYGHPYMLKPHYRPNHPKQPLPTLTPTPPPTPPSGANKSYDSILQYKRRFVERKPESSLNL